MALKRLPNDVQSLLCASAQVNTYRKAVEELVCNSLDAKATSIAIRIHIEESTIQVIDNGSGITKVDFDVLGQKYMTSKLVDLIKLKAAPTFYGYRGEFLSNIITVSEFVKITSRYENTEDTWAKTFQNGKEKKLTKITTRPTKGTTVDIKGFLYNLKIQKRRIDPINEMQNMKAFLEQISLIHNNVSISLRDDSKNEIVFKIHKKRDIYQTIQTLFEVDKSDLQELQVEKNEYKVKGLIGKKDNSIDFHWIFINGKYIQSNSKLHKFVNDRLKKTLLIKDQRKLKSKVNKDDEHQLFNHNLPFYFIFITCPYYDYEYNVTPKHSILEFKDWNQINKLLEKLVKFYVGDINLKEIKKPESKEINNEENIVKFNQDTRNQVKEIMNKILGNNSKKLRVSQLQKGVKGKNIKRKTKLKSSKANLLSTLLPQNDKNCFGNRICMNDKEDNNNSNHKIKTNCQESNTHLPQLPAVQNPAVRKSDTRHKSEIRTQKLRTRAKPHRNQKELLKRNKILMKVTASTQNDFQTEVQEISLKKRKELQKRNNVFNPKNTIPNKKVLQTSVQEKSRFGIKLKAKKNQKKDLKETDSVYKKSKIVAQEVENFLRHCAKRRQISNKDVTKDDYANKPITVRKEHNYDICNNFPLPPKFNKHFIDKNVLHQIRAKTFKTTYDLVQTILLSQQDAINAQKYYINKESYSELTDFDYRRNNTRIPHRQYRPTNRNRRIFSRYSHDAVQDYKTSEYTVCNSKKYTMYNSEDNITKSSSLYKQGNVNYSATCLSEKFRILSEDDWTDAKINSRQRHSLSLIDPMLSRITYESHQYQQYYMHEYPKKHLCLLADNRHHDIRFITTQSRENFVTYDFGKKSKKGSKSIPNKQSEMYFSRLMQTIDESYTIENTKSNENQFMKTNSNIIVSSKDFNRNDIYDQLENKTNENIENHLSDDVIKSIIANTYTLSPHFSCNFSIDNNQFQISHHSKSNERFSTYSIHNYSSGINNGTIQQANFNATNDVPNTRNQSNALYISNSQCSENPPDNIIQPMDVCETVFNDNETVEREFAISFNDNNPIHDSLYGYIGTMEGYNKQIENASLQMNAIATEKISHHFTMHKNPYFNNNGENLNQNDYPDSINKKDSVNPDFENNNNFDAKESRAELNNFNLKNRLRFVPKGMSQIFENCRSKSVCDFNLDEDYFEDNIYDNFVNDVQANTEIYEPIIQHVEDQTTKHINKFQNKVKKDNASLVFDENSLKEVKVLGQADCKFIAVIMKNRDTNLDNAIEHLILFDQHAVHERIRLEQNLTDYIIEDKWVSVPLENIVLKMTKDEILYLHNYKDKFAQLGLQWTISNSNEITINTIPEAILGKIPREVDKVMKAVKNLIIEEINVIKSQKGCVSLYPKSIMDLVFSEACRYAIKFGDPLTKEDCAEFLKDLSHCKTPFQCAHGRPVMAVLMSIKTDARYYKINMSELKRFRLRRK